MQVDYFKTVNSGQKKKMLLFYSVQKIKLSVSFEIPNCRKGSTQITKKR